MYSPVQDTQAGEPDVELRHPTLVGRTSDCDTPPVCGLLTLEV